jgi:hypothetical protein
MTEVGFTSPPGMVAVRMCDNGPVYSLPGINVEIAGGAVQPFIGKLNKRHAGIYAINMPVEEKFTSSRVRKLANADHLVKH